MPPCLTLSIIRYGSRVKWSNPKKGVHPPLHLGLVVIEKGAFGSPSTMVANFTFCLMATFTSYLMPKPAFFDQWNPNIAMSMEEVCGP